MNRPSWIRVAGVALFIATLPAGAAFAAKLFSISLDDVARGRAEVIDPTKINHDRISFGATVTLMDLDTDDECVYMIVGSEETDVKCGRISINSPVARALIGKEEGDEVTIKAPGRTVEYEVVGIKY